ncbi:hypothetical protein V2G26_017853 [Clonostachys chloroleuca]
MSSNLILSLSRLIAGLRRLSRVVFVEMRLLRMLGGELRVPDDGLCAKATDVITGRAPMRTLGQHKRASKLPSVNTIP